VFWSYVFRMRKERYPAIMLYVHTTGSRARGRPGRKWIDNMRDDCSDSGLTLPEATRLAEDRRAWRSAVYNSGCRWVATWSSPSEHYSGWQCTIAYDTRLHVFTLSTGLLQRPAAARSVIGHFPPIPTSAPGNHRHGQLPLVRR